MGNCVGLCDGDKNGVDANDVLARRTPLRSVSLVKQEFQASEIDFEIKYGKLASIRTESLLRNLRIGKSNYVTS